MLIDALALDGRQANELMTGLVGPRPIAWVSTISPEGTANLAPFSFFNAFSFRPPVLAVGPGRRQGREKDSLRNARASGELTISVVTEELAERANLCSGEFGAGVDEWEIAGVTPAPSTDVAPPRVAESPAAFECRVLQVVDLGTEAEPANGLVIARVTVIHVRDDALQEGVPRADVLRLVGRMGGDDWCKTRDRFALARPTSADPDEVRALRDGEILPRPPS